MAAHFKLMTLQASGASDGVAIDGDPGVLGQLTSLLDEPIPTSRS
jgi:hypothetical protein